MKLIDKDALVAEIEKLIDEIYAGQPFDSLSREQQAALWYVKSIMSSIYTLEVKEAVLLIPEEIKKICTIYDNLNQERNCGTVLYNSDETFFNHVLMEYKTIAKNT